MMTLEKADFSTLVDDAQALIPGYDPWAGTAGSGLVFDAAEAARTVDFFTECLTLTKGDLAGNPFALQPWQRAVIANLFGWKRADGKRRYREALIYVPRKNGKSEMVGGLSLRMLFLDNEPGAEVYTAAADREQAAIVFGIAKRMVLAEPELASRCTVGVRAIALEDKGSTLKAISSDANTKHGYHAHCVIVDELHAQRTPELVEVLMTSMGARAQPMIVYLTTADWDRPSICNTKLDYAKKVRDGIFKDPSFLPVIYEAEKGDDWHDPATWARVNPNLGVSIYRDYFEREFQRATEEAAYENTFKRFHLNMRTEQAERLIPMEEWDACAAAPVAPGGRPIWMGLDLATVNDLAALVMVCQAEDGSFDVTPWFWCPRQNAEMRERRHRVPYLTWGQQGHIELTPGNRIDYGFIEKRIVALAQEHKAKEVAFDPYNASHICQQLQEKHGLKMVEFRQGFLSMNEPTKELLRLIKGKQIRHGGNPVLRWMASNLAVRRDASDNLKPDKENSGDKIDGIVALVMALGRAVRNEGGVKASIYATRGIRRL